MSSSRLFTLLTSAVFTAIGAWMIASGKSAGWAPTLFFAMCLVVAIFEPWLPKAPVSEEYQYRLVMSQDEIACEHPVRPRESIRWDDVIKVWYATTSDGPWHLDQWIVLEGEHAGCSFPTDAIGFEVVWEEFKQRFADFDYGPLIRGGTEDAKSLCWDRMRKASESAIMVRESAFTPRHPDQA